MSKGKEKVRKPGAGAEKEVKTKRKDKLEQDRRKQGRNLRGKRKHAQKNYDRTMCTCRV
jgi:hypothetical protein